mgnify:CR=1 FL=1
MPSISQLNTFKTLSIHPFNVTLYLHLQYPCPYKILVTPDFFQFSTFHFASLVHGFTAFFPWPLTISFNRFDIDVVVMNDYYFCCRSVYFHSTKISTLAHDHNRHYHGELINCCDVSVITFHSRIVESQPLPWLCRAEYVYQFHAVFLTCIIY